ncbi:EamA family transporter [Pleomorphomonas diazotrophica]|uniref:EamA family transporter n=2 Tax=Pleomorphomonas diazotrophica TaxID=1166257 RepID=A0A2N3M1C3_9HYPH|nr:DMT family transporter [Pleomorphomonas diazotrophica]PKR90618.1 EamA family transporter [Pleomorphomonas diazotrophica]
MGLLEWGLLLVLSILWGGSFFFSKVALAELPPFTVVLCRVAIAATALYLYLRATGRVIPASGEAWRLFFGMGVINNIIPFSLIFWGQTAIASGLASILNATTPIFAILVAHLLTADEKMTPQKIAGVLLGVLGVAVLMGGNAFAGDGPPLWALLACLGAALSYGFAGILGRRFRRMGISPAVGAFGQTTASTVMMLPLVAFADAPWQLAAPHLVTIGAILALALISTALAYIIYFHVLSVGGATNSSLVTLLIPVSAILLGSLVLGERLSPNHFLGMALIALGLLSIDGRIFAMLRRAPAT